jgi:hypothetical protein
MPMFIHENSLSRTVDAVNEAFFFGQAIPIDERRAVARWIASRQGLPGAYGGLFAGFKSERTAGIRVFTGERVTSASARHILGEESCRALLLLDGRDPSVAAALTHATEWMIERVEQAAEEAGRNSLGTFCCGKCTVGLWRNILAGGLDRQERRLGIGLAKLRTTRDRAGAWRAFPFWYTVLALTEMNRPEARTELRYAAARIEAEARRSPGSTPYARRRNALARRAIEQI